MKVAGRKNDGAWYRANKMIKGLSSAEKGALKLQIQGMGSIGDFLGAIQDFFNAAGLGDSDSYPGSVDDLANAYAYTGIPRQAWFGVLSWDIYDRTGTTPAYVYTPQHRDDAFAFGKEIRKLIKEFTYSRRQALDLTNLNSREEGNVGGIADATEGD